MGNRVMAQKRLKLQRQRRAWAKSLGRKGLQQPNRDIIKMYKHHAKGLEDKDFVDRAADQLGPAIAKRKEALAKQGELEAWLPDGCDMKFQGPGPSSPFQESWVYHNSRKDCFVVIHLDKYNGIERRSTTYSSKELLLMCWEGNAIQWVYKAAIAAR